MSTCERCGATFHCAMKDGPAAGEGAAPCWCTYLPAVVPVPAPVPGSSAEREVAVGCWCPACLAAQIAAWQKGRPAGSD
ncbi:cysteine-rich CWC family protein [Pseudoduganella lurida]|uniref:cysteine-rich CWC family protein n=1 Tax=Pseudoduganella lurida TaxID=1036180 RepID=UPI0011A6AB26|nr:cysteine-rich CWC family protein [Pseudoduganella lurida]